MSKSGKACEMLGLPSDSRLLILNVDDFGMCHTSVESGVRCILDGVASSATVMVPCPWGRYALDVLKKNPVVHFGIHLTAIADHPLYRWGPLLAGESLPTLRDNTGQFWSLDRLEEFLDQVDLGEMEMEFRAQIEAVLKQDLKPTHLDSHCHVHTRRGEIFDMVITLSKEYGLAVRGNWQKFIDKVQSGGFPVPDHPVLDSYDIKTENKPDRYFEMLRELPEGLSEWGLHPAEATAEMRGMTVFWPVRKADYEFCVSTRSKTIIQEEGIQIISYAKLQKLWSEVNDKWAKS